MSQVAELLGAGRVKEAAALCSAQGDEPRAAKLYEQACAYAEAAASALRADLDDALRLAILSGESRLIEDVTRQLVQRRDGERMQSIARSLLDRGYARHAGTVYEAVGEHQQAAAAFAQHGDVLDAVRCYATLRQPAPAARLLEAALRDGTHPHPNALRLALGQLYARHGKHEAAVRALQQLDADAPERAAALPDLAAALKALGLTEALSDVEREMATAGVAPSQQPAEQDEPEMAEAGGVLFGRYEVVREVATTPHARLLEAIDQLSQRRVAVKLLVASAAGGGRDALQRFLREAKALAQLRHPNVLPLVELRPRAPAMVLPWMSGGDLRDLIARGPMAPARAYEIARAVLSALGEAHRLGILHRDIKPSNVLFDDGGTPHLADFGAAHLSESAATVTVGEIGTYAYMAPEQRAGHAASSRSDIYAVGAMLYEMITGTLPEAIGLDAARLSTHHPDLDPRHDELLGRLCAAEQQQRIGNAHDAAKALAALPWPTRLVERSAQRAPSAPPGHAAAQQGRLLPLAGEPLRFRDSRLERDVLVMPLQEGALQRAAAFARADHPALPLVLRADPNAAELWLAAPCGQPVRAVDAGDVARLRTALQRLHEQGQAFGALSLQQLRRIDGHVFLQYAEVTAGASPQDDLRALEALPRS